jgi:hypothetical protein
MKRRIGIVSSIEARQGPRADDWSWHMHAGTMTVRRRALALMLALVAVLTVLTVGAAPAVARPTATFGADTVEPQVTCNYEVWWLPGINLHTEKDRESRIVGFIPEGTILWGRSCENSVGGAYGSCLTGNLWKVISYDGVVGWAPTKCLDRI